MTVKSQNFQTISQIEAAIGAFPAANIEAANAALSRQNILTKPQGALGLMEDLAVFMASWQGVEKPEINLAQMLVFAGNHGAVAQGVSPFPSDVTAIMVENFKAGGAAINQLCKANGAALEVFPIDLDRPTQDISKAPAMSEDELLYALNIGVQSVNPNAELVLIGEMGIGNSTIAAALSYASFGGEAQDWVGAGAGSDADGIARKAQLIDKAIALHKDHLSSPFGILAALGGREQAAMCGAVIAARMHSIPVMVDGYIASSALAPFHQIDGFFDHCLFGHKSAEPGHIRFLNAIGKKPILDLNMRLGEGSGGAVALGILRSALACHNGMATFAEAGISV